jgi:gliding motility-associated-like protein
LRGFQQNMAKKIILLLSLFAILLTDAKAQTPKDNACEAQVFCSTTALNAFSSKIPVPTEPTYMFPKGFCGGSVDGPSWYKFVADAATLQLRFNYSNCGAAGQTGFQAAIFRTTNCNDGAAFTIVSNCLNLSSAQTSGTLTATGLVSGQTYYIFIDGLSGSLCDYDVDVLAGTIKTVNTGDLLAPTVIYGPTEICNLSNNAVFSIPRNPAATTYTFNVSVNGGIPVGGSGVDTSIKVNVPFTPFGFAIVTANYGNNCTQGPDQTLNVTIGNTTTIQLPPIDLNFGQSKMVADSMFDYGPAPLATTNIENATFTRPDNLGGCDTIYKVTVTRFTQTVVLPGRAYFLRPGEVLNLGGTNYSVTSRVCTPIIVGTDTIYNAEQVHTLLPANTILNCNNVRLNANMSFADSCANTTHFKSKRWYYVVNGAFNQFFSGSSQLVSSSAQDSIAVIIRDTVYIKGKLESGFKIYNDTLYATIGGTGSVDRPAQPTLINSVLQTLICEGGVVRYSLSSQTPLATSYTWSLLQNGGTFLTAQGDTSITVRWNSTTARDTLRVTPTNACFSGQPRDLIVNITNFANLTAGPDEIVCGTTTTLNGVSSGGTGQWTSLATNPSLTAFRNTISPTSIVIVPTTGVYRYVWSETKGTCTVSDTVAITFNPTPSVLTGSLVDSCSATRGQAFVRFNMTGGTAPYTVVLNGTNTTTGTVTGNLFKSVGFVPGNYNFQIKDSRNCLSPAISGVQACANCGTNAGTMQAATFTLCEGDTAKATYLGGKALEPDDTLQYVIHTGDPKTGIIARSFTPNFPLLAGMTYGTTYYISAIAGNRIGNNVDLNDACFTSTGARIISVIFNRKPTATMAVVDSNLCRGNCTPINFTATGQAPYNLTIRLTNPNRDSLIVSNTTSFGFTYCPTANTSVRLLSIKDASGCIDSINLNKTTNITVNTPITAGLDTALQVCKGIDTTFNLATLLRGAGAGGTWTETSAVPSSAGAFNTLSRTFRTRNVNAGVYKFGYFLRPTPATSTCPSDTATVTITIQATVTADAGADDTLTCDNPVLLIGGNTPVGTGIQLRWSSIGGFTGGNAPQQEVLKPDTYVLTANANGCVTRDTVIIRIDSTSPRAILTPVLDSITCLRDTITIDASRSTATGVTYLWTLNDIPVDSRNRTIARRGGTYVLTVTNINNGCIAIDSIKVYENIAKPTVFVEPTKDLTCIDSVLTLNAEASSKGANFQIQWQSFGRGHFKSDSTTYSPKVDSAGTYKLLITNTLNGCKDSVFVQVSSKADVPVADAYVNDSLDCYHPTVTIGARGSSLGVGLTYQWLPSPGRLVGEDNALTAVVDEPGSYIFLVKNPATGCASIDTVVVKRIDKRPNNISLNIKKPACYGEQNGSLMVDTVNGGTPPYLYSLDGKVYTPRKSFTNLMAGAYKFYVQDASGCVVDTLFNIVQDRQIGVSLGLDTLLKLGDSLLLNVGVNITNIKRVEWSFYSDSTCKKDSSCLQQWVKPVRETTYRVKVTDTNKCTAEGFINVKIDKTRPVFIPDAFSPNNDGNNDIFVIHGSRVVKKIKRFQIYDRWGEQICDFKDFTPDNPLFGWDGKFKGKDVVPGVYTYFVEVEYLDGIIDLIEGNVTVVR